MARYSKIFSNTISNDINDMSLVAVVDTLIRIKTGQGTAVVSNSTSFNAPWDDAFGAYASVVTDGVWATIVDITGGGYLGTVMSAAAVSTSNVMSLKITLDGRVSEIDYTMPSTTDRRLVLGGYPVEPDLVAAYGAASGIFEFASYGLSTAYPTSTEGINGLRGVSLVPVSDMLTEGQPVIRFGDSLKVEAKLSIVGGAQDAIAFVSYELDSMWVT